MKKVLNLNSPYRVFKDENTLTYFFTTKFNITYRVYFTDANEYFTNFNLTENIFLFGFEYLQNNISNKLEDINIRLTLIAIINRFFENKSNVLVFVADISDFRHKARNRLFNKWKQEFDVNDFIEKYDIEIETEGETFFSSMLIRKDNIHKDEYKKAFLLIPESLSK